MKKQLIGKILIITLLINLVLLPPSKIISAKEQINFKNITIQDGLTQGTVEALFQDSKGYIWLGTNDGLNKYNGYDFKKYSVNEDKENSLINNYILDITEDIDGNIWTATASGLSKIHSDGTSITNYSNDENHGNLSHRNTNCILITKNQQILVGTADGLNIYNKETNNFSRIFEKDNLSSQYINSLTEDDKGNIWIGTENGINKINLSSGESEQFLQTSNPYNLNSTEIYKIYYDYKGYIWAGSYSTGAYKLDLKTSEITHYPYDKKDVTSLPGGMIRNFLRDKSGDMWITTDEGLSKFDNNTETFISHKNKIYDINSLVDNNTFSIIQDKSGLIWVGTYSGVSIFNPSSKVQHYKNDPFDNNTITNNMVSAIYEDTYGSLWIGTRYNGIDILDKNMDKIKNLNTDYIIDNDIIDIAGNDNFVFIGTNKGLTILDLKNKTSKNFDEKTGLTNKSIRSLYYDDLGYLWIGTSSGLYILNLSNYEILDLTEVILKYSPNDSYISDIYKTTSGEYWIGTFIQGGLIRINPESKNVLVYTTDDYDTNSISSNSIRCIIEDSSNNLWIGTSFGLNLLNTKTNDFKRYTTKDGLSNNTIYGVLLDSDGNPWCSTNMGISKLNINTNIISTINITDGLQSNEFNGNAFFKSQNNKLLFGGINGFNIIAPETLKDDGAAYDIIFNKFKINGLEVPNIDNTKLSYDENNIYIDAFVANYKNIDGIKYFYLLEGATDEWIPMDGHSITLSNLSPGNYKFHIKARGNNGIVSNESILTFKINSPIWASNVAILLYLILLAFAVFNSKAKVKKLDRLVSQRTKELSDEMKTNKELFEKVIELEKRKNSYLINLSHELRTPLNVIYSTEQLIRELNKQDKGIERSKLESYMLIMRNNTKRLLKIINDLVDTSKIEHGSYKIDLKPIDIVYVVEEAALSLSNYIEKQDIDLIIDPEIEEKIIHADSTEIERCIVNIVNNASKFTPAGGFIKVEIKDLNEWVKIEITDNGKGIDKKYHELIFNRFNQVVDSNSEVHKGSGLGLTITKKIIQLHQGTIHVESELGKGSKFIILLPVKQKKSWPTEDLFK
ncbi:ligand-binding sensor domain-containing protein [Clostridium sp.]|uniref:ligand-binding sensor domain-containing protein n=1 Tax=Clostridium sp. TaxID=1506 RepID=UPI003F31DA12